MITTDYAALPLPMLHDLKHKLAPGSRARCEVESAIARKAEEERTPSLAEKRSVFSKSARAKSREVEHHEQVALFRKAEELTPRYPDLALMFAVPNGGDRNPIVAGKMKQEGAKAGVLDVWLPVARGPYLGCVTEMKAEYDYPRPDGRTERKRGKTSKEQDWWIEQLRAAGHFVQVCWSAGEALKGIIHYLELPPRGGGN